MTLAERIVRWQWRWWKKWCKSHKDWHQFLPFWKRCGRHPIPGLQCHHTSASSSQLFQFSQLMNFHFQGGRKLWSVLPFQPGQMVSIIFCVKSSLRHHATLCSCSCSWFSVKTKKVNTSVHWMYIECLAFTHVSARRSITWCIGFSSSSTENFLGTLLFLLLLTASWGGLEFGVCNTSSSSSSQNSWCCWKMLESSRWWATASMAGFCPVSNLTSTTV